MNRKIRVLHVIGEMNRAGAETMIMNLYRFIDKSRIQFDFLVHTSKECDYDKEIEEFGGTIYRIHKFKGYNYISYKKECSVFFKNHNDYDIIHGHIGSSAAIYLKEAKRNGIYTIAHSHNTDSHTLKPRDLAFRLFTYPTKYIADYFFACATDAGLARYGKKIVESKLFSVIPNAIDIKKFEYNDKARNEIRKKLKIDKNAYCVGTIGRITKQKNPYFILRIFQSILEIDKTAVCIWLGKGPLEGKIKSLAKSYNIYERIRFTGIVENVNDYLMAFDSFVLPSLYEGLPLVAIEAQASGLPCFISKTVSKDVKQTNLVDFYSIDKNEIEWAKRILNNKKRRNRKEYNDKMFDTDYNIINSSKNILKIYSSLLLTKEVSEINKNDENNKN